LKPACLTVKYDGRPRELASPFTVRKAGEDIQFTGIAIWDTGSTATVITKQIVKELDLKPTGKVKVSSVNGLDTKNTYTIDLLLQNGVLIEGLVTTETDSLNGPFHALIGMDIILLGDLSVTNHKNKTVMSFRIPSSHEIDYVQSPDFGIVKVSNVGKRKGGKN
jgi:hypothetical protein